MTTRALAAGVILLSVAPLGCRGEIPASLVLTVMPGPEAPAAETLVVRVFDAHGVAHGDARFPVPQAAGAAPLGTLVIYPRAAGSAAGSLALRVQVQGLVGDSVVCEGTLASLLAAGQQSRQSVVLAAARRPDGDRDGVPDEIDNCPAFANPAQADGDGDGRADDCQPPADAGAETGSDGGADSGSEAGDAGDDGGLGAEDGPGGPLGATCSDGATCASGHCVDGVCCESVCGDVCRACNLAGLEGRCAPVAAGQADPRQRCAAEAPESCGQDGTCNGAGACRLHRLGTVCGVPSCASGSERVLPALCDGRGTCQAARVQSCAPYRCAAAECTTGCSGPQDCAGGSACVNGSCGRKPLGATCTTGTDCNSGSCVDGVCCDVADCSGPCRACNLAGAEGSCRSLTVNAEPRAAGCPVEAVASCGRTGKCDGAGACQLHAAGTVCQPPSCVGSTQMAAGSCSGTGSCVAGASQSCGIYACNGGTCATSCTTDAHCAAGHYCGGRNICRVLAANGTSCGEPRECASGFCVLGRCCATATCL